LFAARQWQRRDGSGHIAADHHAGMDVGRLDAAARRTLGFDFVPEDRLGRGAVPEMSLALNSLLKAHPLKLLRHGLVDRARALAFTK
ncbi:hypothetical protein ACC699_38880, partial [Rhizobium ruizarguesonis]